MDKKVMYDIENACIHASMTGDNVESIVDTHPMRDEIIAEVLDHSGKYGDVLLMACSMLRYKE